MNVHILSHLASELDGAYRVLETLVLRTKGGQVFTIEAGESLFNASHPFAAKVTLASENNDHIGISQGATLEHVLSAAQQMVSRAISESELRFTPPSHRRHKEMVSA
jgi:hypothetical protein